MYTVYFKPGFDIYIDGMKGDLNAVECLYFIINEESKSVTLFDDQCTNQPSGFFPLEAIKGIIKK